MSDHWDHHPIGKTCYCRTRNKWYHYLGIAMHRVGHKNRGEVCVITYTNGDTYNHPLPEQKHEC